MFQHELDLFRRELSGEAARGLVARISQWHRIQASPMYREAATWLHATLQSWGLDADLESFPTDDGLMAWGEPLIQEWSCAEGWLDLLHPDGSAERLADYRALPLSLMPRSVSADGEFELVVVEGGDRPADYAGLDVRGKLVLTRCSPMSAHRVAVEQLGAAGLIFDGMRTIAGICPPGDLPDAVQYASFWWWGGETRCFGFALSPRAGAELRRRHERARRDGRPVRLRACVRSRLAPGAIEAVSALIPGETSEEVLLIAHLCHPAPCANDNASGAAAAMEVARGLHALIAAGRLPRPRRSIRVLWVPEMTGTYLYLAAHEDRIPRTIAGLNLDMVGADQAQTGSVSLIVHPSDALPSFAADLLEALRDQTQGPAHSFYGRADGPLYRFGSAPFSNGSDHYILADPSVGIPTPQIVEWPDRFYHTSADTVDKVSAETLSRNMALAATYVWAVADGGPRTAAWLAGELNARFARRLARELQSAVAAALGGAAPEGAPWAERLAFRVERHGAALASLVNLDPAFDPAPHSRAAASLAELLWAQSGETLAAWHPAERPELSPAEAALVPARRFRGPVSLQPHLARLAPADRAAIDADLRAARPLDSLAADIALFWADGRRTLGQILDLVELETEVRRPEALAAHFRVLARLGLVELRG
jgi:aminopeptidase YwaD